MADHWCRASWGQIQEGDVVLMPWSGLSEVVEAEVLGVDREQDQADSRRLMYADLQIGETNFPRWSFDPTATAYVKARF
jgi:hypothetical protein